MMQTTYGDERTSLAIAEVRQEDCEVVIYRNNPADLQIVCNDDVKLAITQSRNLVITGTSLIEADSRKQTLKMMVHAQKNDCKVWLDLDYRPWNWPDQKTTRLVYQEAAELTNVLVGNEEEFKILQEDINIQVKQCVASNQVMILKRGKSGCSLFFGKDRLDAGIYNLPALKPYGSGDAFLGNVIINYMSSRDWQLAIEAGSAAAALVVSKQGCASAMPKMEEIELLQKRYNNQTKNNLELNMHIPQHDNKNKAIVDCNNEVVPLCYFNIIKLSAGESYTYQLTDYESCIVPATGSIDVQVQGQVFKEVGKRQHIWEGDPEGVYVPVDCEATLICISNEVEVFMFWSKA